jgi:hypothetical protein
MAARRLALARLVRLLAVPVTLALPPLFLVSEATRRASLTTLGRDQGIFQYVAWAIAQGERDYRDIRDVNGPLTHLVHRVLLALGGADEHRFRVLDLAMTGVTFAFVGACLPGLGSRGRHVPGWVERLAWALVGWVVLSAQYLLYVYWDLAQRESFFDWFLLPSVALQLVVQAPAETPEATARRLRWFAAVGALGVVPWFGKPTNVLLTAVQMAAVFADPALAGRGVRKRVVGAFALGAVAGALVPLGWLLLHGDIGAYLHVQVADVPAMYRFIWPRSPADVLSIPWDASQFIYAVVGAVVLLSLVALGEMPARVVAPALFPVAAFLGVLAQGKAFPYHFHPVTAGVYLQWLTFAAWLGERARVARRDRALVRLAPLGVAAFFAVHVATSMEDSPHMRAAWMLWGLQTPEDRSTREYFAHFPEPDFFPYEMRQTAEYLRAHTAPPDRVQIYGMDPYLLFLAGRLSATPYIYAYDLDVDFALAGGTGAIPDAGQRARIRAIRDAHEQDFLARLEARPPAAFVFFDGAPLMSEHDAWKDFEKHCPRSAQWVAAHYGEAQRFGHDHVWFRNDRLPVEPAEAPTKSGAPDAPDGSNEGPPPDPP